MDLNELLYAHQLEVMKASASGDANHIGLIAEYAERIRQLRTVSRSTPIAQDPSAPPTIIYGSYAGHSATAEGEAHSLRDSDTARRAQCENPDQGRADT